jgi:hypothetical protein
MARSYFFPFSCIVLRSAPLLLGHKMISRRLLLSPWRLQYVHGVQCLLCAVCAPRGQCILRSTQLIAPHLYTALLGAMVCVVCALCRARNSTWDCLQAKTHCVVCCHRCQRQRTTPSPQAW